MTKEEYENLINSSAIFDIGSEDEALFKTEFRKLVKHIVVYYMLISKSLRNELNFDVDNKEEKTDVLSYQLIITARACVKSYKKSDGSFLNYFNAAFKHNRVRAAAVDKSKSKRGGLTLGRENERLLSALIRYAKSRGKLIDDEEVQNKFALAAGCAVAKIKKLVKANNEAVCVGEYVRGEDGEDLSLIDGKALDERSAEDTVEQQSQVQTLLNGIAALFVEQQERTKPMLGKLLTVWLINRLADKQAVRTYLDGQAFIDGDILRTYLQSGNLPTAKNIAEQFGVAESHASRSLNNFKEKIIKYVKL